jgi:hypothetical protein
VKSGLVERTLDSKGTLSAIVKTVDLDSGGGNNSDFDEPTTATADSCSNDSLTRCAVHFQATSQPRLFFRLKRFAFLFQYSHQQLVMGLTPEHVRFYIQGRFCQEGLL